MILCGDTSVVGVVWLEGVVPWEGNQEAGREGGAGKVNKYVTISDRD